MLCLGDFNHRTRWDDDSFLIFNGIMFFILCLHTKYTLTLITQKSHAFFIFFIKFRLKWARQFCHNSFYSLWPKLFVSVDVAVGWVSATPFSRYFGAFWLVDFFVFKNSSVVVGLPGKRKVFYLVGRGRDFCGGPQMRQTGQMCAYLYVCLL